MFFIYRQPVVYYLLLAMIAILTATANWWLSGQRLKPMQFSDYASYRCTTTDSPATQQTFRILSVTSMKAIALADALCKSATISRRYDQVVIEWRPRGFLTAQDLVEQKYDLFLNRRYPMLGLVPEFYEYYSALLDLPPYAVSWVSRESKPELTQAYFTGKTVGLLEDFHSQSFYLLPMNSLREAGVTLNESQKRLYPDMQALFHAFNAGEVDVISSPESFSEGLDGAPVYRLSITEEATPATWFIKRNTHNDLACNLLGTLQNSAAQLVGHVPVDRDHWKCT